ncbi:hypothetical protein HBH1_04397 [Herbaspirillum sp. BH-1]|uniref:hypothetical protein n=1 Tax=Herbaspirillum sp. (strain BH-1) TaxID=2058884 RepID=UPI000CC05865|nr:hypothetical protein [Herbaspirillum sp. BH-1]PLY57305.1 hypothetical protein HBH1_04397 [Herbaspirillum sp. BH-1]
MDLKEKLAVASGFGIITSACYLFGFWGAFHINVMEFAGVTDLAKLASFPLIAGLLSILFGTAIPEILHNPRLSPGAGASTTVGRLGRKHWRIIVALQVLAIPLVAILGSEPYKWLFVALLIGLLSIPLSHVDFVIAVLPVPRIRHTALYLLLCIPPTAFWFGRSDAHIIKHDQPVHVVDIARSKLEFKETPEKRVAFLGRVGDYNFFYESLTDTVAFAKQSDGSTLYLLHPHRDWRAAWM